MKARIILLTLAICFFSCCLNCCMAVTLSAPERCDVGRLCQVASNVEGDFMVYPPDGADMAKDTDGKILYFVPLRKCDMTVIFFGVEDGKPVISQAMIQVGGKPSPSPDPEPSPNPTPVVKLNDREKSAAKAALNAVISGVDAGTIQTPAGARSLFKQTLVARGQVCDGTSCRLPAALTAISNDWTERADFSSMEAIKKSFEGFLKEVE